ncbi:MAG: hypothetical protein R3B89_14960 [Polyangiaceae bacterium]
MSSGGHVESKTPGWFLAMQPTGIPLMLGSTEVSTPHAAPVEPAQQAGSVIAPSTLTGEQA